MAAFDLRSDSLHLSQYIETSTSYQNTKTLMHFCEPMVIIIPPNKLAPDGMVGVSELLDKCYPSVKKVKLPPDGSGLALLYSPELFQIFNRFSFFVFCRW